jgi:hypothetical protein
LIASERWTIVVTAVSRSGIGRLIICRPAGQARAEGDERSNRGRYRALGKVAFKLTT